MNGPVRILDLNSFDASFGEVGLKVGPRTGPRKRTKGDKEWYVARRFIKEIAVARRLGFPLVIRRGNPPDEPDFILECSGALILFEVTEATSEADQREMTAIETSDKPAVLLGEFGGRFSGGADNTGSVWAADIIDAVSRKAGKSIFKKSNLDRHLVIYPNSNASSLLLDGDDEREAAQLLRAEINGIAKDLAHVVNGCQVHILGKELVFLDIFGEFAALARN